MIRKFVFIALLSLVSMMAPAQNFKMGPAALFPDAWGAGRELIKTISEGVFNRHKIQEEAQKRKLGIPGLFGDKKSYSETMAERRQRIKTLRQEILDANRYLKPVGTKSSHELESELFSLLDLGSLPEEEERDSSMFEETDKPFLIEKSARFQNWQVPGMLLAPRADGNAQGSDLPEGFSCPITREVMKDPVIAADGFSYERAAIEKWIRENNHQGRVHSPKTREPLAHLNLNPNFTLREIMQAFSIGMIRTVAIQASPWVRTLDWYQGPREIREVGALEWDLGDGVSRQMTFEEALVYAGVRLVDGWRLPTIQELEALYQQRGFLSNALDTSSWSASVVEIGDDVWHWGFDLRTGSVASLYGSSRAGVKLVRDFLPVPQKPAELTVRTQAADNVRPHNELAAGKVSALEWELGRKDSPKMTFSQARDYAVSRAAEGWRLPTIFELYTLYQQKEVLGADFDPNWFWSDTAVVHFNGYHWDVNFTNGNVSGGFHKYYHPVRLVRGVAG